MRRRQRVLDTGRCRQVGVEQRETFPRGPLTTCNPHPGGWGVRGPLPPFASCRLPGLDGPPWGWGAIHIG